MTLNTLFSTFAFMLLLTCTSCVKEGPIGPAGPQGERGLTGEQGEVGPPGTAVTHSEFIFEGITVAAGLVGTQLNFPVSKEDFEKSIMLVYGKRGINWLQLPGTSAGSLNTYRYYTNHYASSEATTTYITIQRTAGPGPETFDKIRIIIIPL